MRSLRHRRGEGGRRALIRGIRAQATPLFFNVPDSSPRARFAFGLLAYAFAAIMVGTTLPTPMYALYAEHMHFAVLTTTVIYATYAGGVLFALLAFGHSSDAIGRRPVLAAGVAFAVASAAVFLVADSVPMLLVGRVLSGLSAGLFTGTATAAVIEAPPAGAPGPPASQRSRIWAGWASGHCWQDYSSNTHRLHCT